MVLETIRSHMEEMGIPYQFWEFDGHEDLYFVGETIENPASQEDGRESGLFVLSGWSFVGLARLMDSVDRIKARYRDPVHVATPFGAVVLEYSHSVNVPVDVEDVCRIEVNINYAEWSIEHA